MMRVLGRTCVALCLFAVGNGAIGCSNGRSLRWEIAFDDGLADRAAIVIGRIRAGGCDGDVLFEDDVAPGEAASMPTSLEPGTYAFEGVARDASCMEYARGCVEVELPADEQSVTVTLSASGGSSACDASACDEGRCRADDAGTPIDGGGVDAGRDAGSDAGRDAGSDAGSDAPAPRVLANGDSVRIDFGTATSSGWTNHTDIASSTSPMVSEGGATVDVRVTTSGFNGVQLGGSMTNTLGYPGTASSDTFWVGSFDGHDAALTLTGVVELSGLAPGNYMVEVFASRDGDDTGIGRLTRYRLDTRTQDLEVSDNTSRSVTLSPVRPDASGRLRLEVTVSPSGTGRFGYIGTLILTRP